MTALTVWGTAARVDETAAHYDEWGRLTSAHSVKEFDLGLPDDPIRVTFRHDLADWRPSAGSRLEIDDLAEYEGKVFYSRDYTGYGRNMVRTHLHRPARLDHRDERDAVARRLRSQSQPAQDAARRPPTQHRPYSLWPSSWRSDALLERAVEQVPSLNPEEHRAKRIVDERGLLDPDQEALMYYAHSALERGLSRRHDGKIE